MGTLRFLLALSVAYGHLAVPLRFPTADIAVQSFFVISGFYMALVLNEKYRPGSYWLFISNRLLRLWPAYAVVLILSLAAADNWKPIFALDWPSAALFAASQLLIVGQDLYFFLSVGHDTLVLTAHQAETSAPLFRFAPVPQAWTLALEIYFYLLAPFLVRRGPMFIAALIAASLLLRLALQGVLGLNGHPWSYRFFPSEMALFLAGSLGYWLCASTTKGQRRRALLLLLVAAVLVFASLAINNWDGVQRLASLSLLAAIIVGVPRLFELTKSFDIDRYVGELSYPLYICHFLFGWLLLPNTYSGVYTALLLSLATSVVLYHLIDRPLDAWRQQRLDRSQRSIAVSRLKPSAQAIGGGGRHV
jgi:peptidoglycan/LPS O-acetylase OafA/YrhL